MTGAVNCVPDGARSSIGCMNLCFISQALFWEIFSWRDSSREDIPFLAWVMRCMAINHTFGASLVPAKTVPTVKEDLPAAAFALDQPPASEHAAMRVPAGGPDKPRGQRQANSARSHCSTIAYLAMSSCKPMPRGNCTPFFGIAHLLLLLSDVSMRTPLAHWLSL